MDQDAAIRVDQKRVSVAVQPQRADHLHQDFQAQVAANYTGHAGVSLDRCGKGHDQALGHGVQIRLGQDGFAGAKGIDIPRSGSWVVVGRHVIRRLGDEGAIASALVNAHEGGDQRGLPEYPILLLRGLRRRRVFRQVLYQKNSP